MDEPSRPARRLFVAALAPEPVRALVGRIRSDLGGGDLPLRWIDPAGAHITLQFLGATPAARVPELTAALGEVASRAQAARLRTVRLGAFPNPRRPRVLWLGLDGETERLDMLQSAVVAATSRLGFVAEDRPFQPHLTLARARAQPTSQDQACVAQALAAASAPPSLTWLVDEIALMESLLSRTGATYQALERWPLLDR